MSKTKPTWRSKWTAEYEATGDPNDDLTDYYDRIPANPHLGCATRSRFRILTGDKNGVGIDILKDNPEGFSTYRRVFSFKLRRQFEIQRNEVTQRVTIRQAEQIALFLLRHAMRARWQLAVRRVRIAMGRPTITLD